MDKRIETSPNTDKNYYYYNQGKRIRISKRPDLVAVVFDSRTSRENISLFERSNNAKIYPTEEFKDIQQSNVRIFNVPGRESTDNREPLEGLSSEPNIEKVGEVYVNEYSQPLV